MKITGAELKGLKKLQETLEKYKKGRVKVGVLGGNHPDSGESFASIAMLHEFGSESPRKFTYKGRSMVIKGVPTRSFLRMPLRKHKSQLTGRGMYNKTVFRMALLKDFEHGYTGVPLKLMGANGEAIIQDAFDSGGDGQWPRNISEAYIELKGSDTPLIDTGALRNSITSKLSDEG